MWGIPACGACLQVVGRACLPELGPGCSVRIRLGHRVHWLRLAFLPQPLHSSNIRSVSLMHQFGFENHFSNRIACCIQRNRCRWSVSVRPTAPRSHRPKRASGGLLPIPPPYRDGPCLDRPAPQPSADTIAGGRLCRHASRPRTRGASHVRRSDCNVEPMSSIISFRLVAICDCSMTIPIGRRAAVGTTTPSNSHSNCSINSDASPQPI